MANDTYVDVDLESTFLLQTLRQLTSLFITDILDLPPSTLDLLLAQLLHRFARLLLLLETRELRTATRLFLLLAHGELGQELAAASDDSPAQLQCFPLRLSGSDERGELRLLLFLRGGRRRVERRERVVEAGREAAEARAHELGRRGLHGAGGGGRGCGRARVLDEGEGAVDEGDRALGVVDADVQLAPARTAHDVRLDLLVVEDLCAFDAEVADGRDEVMKGGDVDGGVHLGELRQEAREEGALEEGDVRRIRAVGWECLQ